MDILPDIQENTEPEIKEAIDFMGIQKIKMPILFIDNQNSFKVLTTVTAGVNLSSFIRAASLSEFMIYLKEYIDKPMIIPDDVLKLLKDFHKISRDDKYWKISNIKFDFEYKKNISSPVSDNIFPQFYKCFYKFSLLGDDNTLNIYQGLEIPYFSSCPCSQSLSINNGGIPHSQRSKLNLFLHNKKTECFNHLISKFEDIVVNKMYPIIRRMDEQKIAITASKNTFFVEDIIRRAIHKLNSIDNIEDWIVKCCHEDSIHSHNVVAIAYKGIDHGFNQYTKI